MQVVYNCISYAKGNLLSHVVEVVESMVTLIYTPHPQTPRQPPSDQTVSYHPHFTHTASATHTRTVEIGVYWLVLK